MFYFSRVMRVYSLVDGDLSHEWISVDEALRGEESCMVCERPRHGIVPMYMSNKDAGLCVCPAFIVRPEGQEQQRV